MWTEVLNKPKHEKVFRDFIEELINYEVYYEEEAERINISDSIEWVVPEEDNQLSTVQNGLSHSDAVQTGIGQKNELSTHSPQECVE